MQVDWRVGGGGVMAGIIVGMTLERLPARNHLVLAVAVALADAADQDGSNVYPAVVRVARLARCSERAVQSAIQELQQIGFLLLVERGGGRGRPSRYLIDRGWLEVQPSVLGDKGAGGAPFAERVHVDEKTPQKPHKKGAPGTGKGCTNPAPAGAPNPRPIDPRPPTPPAHAREGAAGGGGVVRAEDVDELVEAAVWAANAAGRPPRSPVAFAGAVRRRLAAAGVNASDLETLTRFRASRDTEARYKERLAESARRVLVEAGGHAR